MTIEDHAARCAQEGGIDEALIEHLVRTFYTRVRSDAVIGPIFNERVHDWEEHFRILTDFWSNVLLKTQRYNGQTLRVHAVLPIAAPHFARWLELFAATARELCSPACAMLFIAYAERIAASLQLGIAVAQGELPPRPVRPTAAIVS